MGWWNVFPFPHESRFSLFVRPIISNVWSYPSRKANSALFEPSLKTSCPVPTNFQSSTCYITVINNILLNTTQDKSTQTKRNSLVMLSRKKKKKKKANENPAFALQIEKMVVDFSTKLLVSFFEVHLPFSGPFSCRKPSGMILDTISGIVSCRLKSGFIPNLWTYPIDCFDQCFLFCRKTSSNLYSFHFLGHFLLPLMVWRGRYEVFSSYRFWSFC